ncbi:8331_t:CDS:2, partial [Funneliformis geosporum]
MVDESTCEEIKNFILCYQVWSEKEQTPIVIMASLKDIPKYNSKIVSNIVAQSIQEDGLDTTKCIFYNSNNKDKPLNLNASIIKDLYDKLMGFHYNQYQLPLRSRWDYELRTAKQYLDRCEAHILFT